MKIVLRHTLHKDLWSVNGGKGPGKSSRRRDDGKELLDDAAKCMRPKEIILRRRFCPAIPSPSWKELEGSLPEKLNLKVSPQNPEVAQASSWSGKGMPPILDKWRLDLYLNRQ